jgi:hypothetical protein
LHEAIETEALSQGVITTVVRHALDRLLPVPLDQVLAREKEERRRLEAKFRAIDPSHLVEEEEQAEEPELPEALLAIAGEMDGAHWVRQAQGKLRRTLVKAGRKPSEPEISALLSRCIELEVPLTERSGSRIARAIKGKITLKSLR